MDAAQAYLQHLTQTNLLHRIDLPQGDTGSININWINKDSTVSNYNPESWLLNGKVGVEFKGKGIDQTHIRCTHWDGVTIGVRQHPGLVVVRDATIHAGYEKAIHFGTSGWTLVPAFGLLLQNCKIEIPDQRPDGGRTRWGVFTYIANCMYDGVEITGAPLGEHNFYHHGTGGIGLYMRHCKLNSSGAEGFKLRSARSYNDTHPETPWAGSNVAVIIEDTTIADWYQPHSWRGGAGIVIQGGACNFSAKRVKFYPGPGHSEASAARRSYCIAISSEGDSYDIDTGALGQGHGNGHVQVKDCAMVSSGVGSSDYTMKIVRVGRNGGGQYAAKSVAIEGCGVYGENMQVQLGDIGSGGIRIDNCNKPSMADLLENQFGMPVERDGSGNAREAVYFQGGKKPMSVDYASA